MSATTERPAGTTAIRPFTIPVTPEAELEALRARITATRWPDPELVTDFSQGVQQAVIQELARYWATEYDMHRCEARLGALPHFVTEIDGLDIHFIHVRSPHANALPVIITHGWPGSVIELLNVIDPLTNPTAHGGERGRRLRRGHPVDAGLRVLRQAAGPRLGPRPDSTGLGHADEAPRLPEVRGARRRLGRDHHRPDGRAGTCGAARHPQQHGRRRPGGCLAGAGAQRVRGGRPAAIRPVGGGKPLVRAAELLLHHGCRVRGADGDASRRPCTAWRTRPSPWRPG